MRTGAVRDGRPAGGWGAAETGQGLPGRSKMDSRARVVAGFRADGSGDVFQCGSGVGGATDLALGRPGPSPVAWAHGRGVFLGTRRGLLERPAPWHQHRPDGRGGRGLRHRIRGPGAKTAAGNHGGLAPEPHSGGSAGEPERFALRRPADGLRVLRVSRHRRRCFGPAGRILRAMAQRCPRRSARMGWVGRAVLRKAPLPTGPWEPWCCTSTGK